MHNRALIPGPVLLGFADLFDEAWGKPGAGPIPVVTPTAIGGALLPFACPHCGAARKAAVDPRLREGYRDPWRCFSWCPACRGRYRLNTDGGPLPAPMLPGAKAAPAQVAVGRASYVTCDLPRAGDLDLLGA